MFLTLRYWVSSAIPETLIAFCLAQSSLKDSVLELPVEFSSELVQLYPLIEVTQTEGAITEEGEGSRSGESAYSTMPAQGC